MQLAFQGRFGSGQTVLDSDLRDLHILSLGDQLALFAAGGNGSGISSYRLRDGQLATFQDSLYYSQNNSRLSAGHLLPLPSTRAETGPNTGTDTGTGSTDTDQPLPQLAFATAGALQVLTLSGTGQITSPTALFAPADAPGTDPSAQAGAPLSAVTSLQIGNTTALYLAGGGMGHCAMYQGPPSQTTLGGQRTEGVLSGARALGSATVDGQSYLLSLSSQQVHYPRADTTQTTPFNHASVTSYRINTNTGALTPLATLGSADGLGIANPTAMELVTAHGAQWVILSGADSQSLSVMRLGADGSLNATDHVIDTRTTRFAGAQSLAVVEVTGRDPDAIPTGSTPEASADMGSHVFVITGGGDDGLSLFSLLPNGRLAHLDTLIHQQGHGLQNIRQITAHQIGNTLQIFAASGDHPGLSQITVDLSTLGLGAVSATGDNSQTTRHTGGTGDDLLMTGSTQDNSQTLTGGAGNDTLVAGQFDSLLTGGAGGDLFVLSDGGHQTRITDFDPTVDRLDLSAWPMLRSGAQLQITATTTGGEVRYRDNTLILTTATGDPLSTAQISALGGGFSTPDRSLFLGDPLGLILNGDIRPEALSGGNGADTLTANAGDDSLSGHGGSDLINAGAGDDTIWGGAGDDTAWGAAGSDTLWGGTGNDALGGGLDNDQIWAGSGNDQLFGGAGHDELGAATGDDTIWASAGHDRLYGGSGRDEIGGGAGSDLVWAGADNDMVYGGAGWDELGGGAGNDTIWAGDGNDTVYGGSGDDTLGAGRDDDTVWAGLGNDLIYGGEGNDVVGGGEGNDTLWASAGHDLIYGDGGDDRLSGGPGDDTLFGGTGADTFVFGHTATGQADPHSGDDLIRDFTIGSDQLHFTSAGTGTETNTGTTSLSDLRFTASAQGLQIRYDSGTILLEGVTASALSASDVLFG